MKPGSTWIDQEIVFKIPAKPVKSKIMLKGGRLCLK